jgi:hypothetical protein
MAKTKFSFTTAEGKVETRTSERPYTHVVVNRANVAALRVEAVSDAHRKQDRKNFAFTAAMAAGEVGKIPVVPGGWNWPLEQDRKDKAVAFIAPYRDADDFADKQAAARLERLNKQYGDADVGPEYVAQWSMSEANARKGVRMSPYLASSRVVALDSGWVPDPTDPTGEKKDAVLLAARRNRK